MQKRTLKRRWWVTIVQICCLLALLYLCLFNFSVVRGNSMAPGIHDGDRILIDHFSYLFSDIDRGDLVVFKYPLDPWFNYIKRVIAVPGDTVMMVNGQVWVNGEKLAESYVASQDFIARVHERVPPGHYFVLGDNRPRSCDSREFGFVPRSFIRGKVELRVWPPGRIGVIGSDRGSFRVVAAREQ